MGVKIMEQKDLSFYERCYLPQIFKALKLTFKRMFRRKITLQYPEERPPIPDGYRGIPALVKDQFGREKCVSCQLCEFVCPPKAIVMQPGSVAGGHWRHIEKAPKSFEIDMLRCIYCGLCEEVCPEEAIFLQKDYSLSGYRREDFRLNKEQLYQLGGTRADRHEKWEKKRQASLKAPHTALSKQAYRKEEL